MVDIALTTEIIGRDSVGNIQEEAFRKIRSEAHKTYDSANSVTVPNGASDSDVTSLAGGSDLFVNVPRAAIIEVFSDVDVSMKFRTEGNIPIATASLGPINVRGNTLRTITQIADTTALFFSNASGGPATIEVLIT